MTLRVSHLVAALVLLSLGNCQINVNAADCTDEEQAYIDENYSSTMEGVDSVRSSDACSFSCQGQLSSSVASPPGCTASDGTSYYETLAADYACTESSSSASTTSSEFSDNGACSEENEATVNELIESYAPDDCEPDPCESSCMASLKDLAIELPYCTSSDSTNYYELYSSWTADCPSSSSDSTASEETIEAPAETTATPTATTSDNSTSTEASEGGRKLRQASGSAEEEASASAAGSASASNENGAAIVGGSAIGLLVVTTTLALLAAQA